MADDLKDLGLTVNHLLRYGYSGLLTLGLAAGLFGSRLTEKFLTNPLASLAAAFAIGAAVYVAYRPFGDTFFFTRFHRIHWRRKAIVVGGMPTNCRCRFQFLTLTHRVPPRRAHNAYRLVRDVLFEPERRASFENLHSEVHILFTTGFILGLGSWGTVIFAKLFGYIYEYRMIPPMAVFGALFILLGLWADCNLCEGEELYLRTFPKRDGIQKLLDEAGMTTKVDRPMDDRPV